MKAKKHGLDCLRVYDEFWRTKARVNWLKDGDRSSKFFHLYAKITFAWSKFIHLKINENFVEDLAEISNHVNYFADSYAYKGNVSNLAL